MATKPRQSAAGGRGKTALQAKGINVNLLASPDNFYLCQKICAAKKFPTAKLSKLAKLGYYLSPQLSVDGMIMLDYHLFEGKWRYVPEVSFDMRHTPPKPILAKHQLFPPNYPYWGMPRKGTRRPDVIIIDGEDSHAMEQKNLIRVVEIKFGKDQLGRKQQDAYEKIAGSEVKFTCLTDNDCDCSDKEDEHKKQTQPVGEPVPVPVPVLAREPNLADTFEELYNGLKNKKIPIYAPIPHPAVVPVLPKKPKPKPKPLVDLAPYASRAPYANVPPLLRPMTIPHNAAPVFNRQDSRWEWVVPTLKTIGTVVLVAVAVVAVAVVAGWAIAAVSAGTAVYATASFMVVGAAALLARYGQTATNHLNQLAL